MRTGLFPEKIPLPAVLAVPSGDAAAVASAEVASVPSAAAASLAAPGELTLKRVALTLEPRVLRRAV